jgi:hypothetical protein
VHRLPFPAASHITTCQPRFGEDHHHCYRRSRASYTSRLPHQFPHRLSSESDSESSNSSSSSSSPSPLSSPPHLYIRSANIYGLHARCILLPEQPDIHACPMTMYKDTLSVIMFVFGVIIIVGGFGAMEGDFSTETPLGCSFSGYHRHTNSEWVLITSGRQQLVNEKSKIVGKMYGIWLRVGTSMGYVLLGTYGFCCTNPCPPTRWNGSAMTFKGLCSYGLKVWVTGLDCTIYGHGAVLNLIHYAYSAGLHIDKDICTHVRCICP